jgi:succinate-semialdehyde dehydrogenase/glutarate-semialdehyde dehydrogenase
MEVAMTTQSINLRNDLCYVNGGWISAHSGETFPVNNPSSGEIIAEIPLMGPNETCEAIAAAEKAQKEWSLRTAKDRSDILYGWYDLISGNADELAKLLTLEQGKPVKEAKGEIAYAASFVRFYAEEARQESGLGREGSHHGLDEFLELKYLCFGEI